LRNRRVVITGLGLLTPLGHDVESSWKAIKAGQSGIRLVDSFDTELFASKIAGFVKDFDPSPYISSKNARRFDTFVQYGIAAACQAIAHAGLDANQLNADRIGVSIGSGIGGLPMIEKNHAALTDNGPRKISPFFIPGAIINILSGQVAIMNGFKGPNTAIVTACTTGTHNIGSAARMIDYGDADVMVAGGAEMATSPLGLGGFAAMRALSTRNDEPEKASRPWDKNRDGFVLGDGAGVLVLEEYEHAKARGAEIFAELIGYGMSADAHHITSPAGDGAMKSMQNAIADAKVNAQVVDYINAHGTSTPAGDVVEAQAVKNAFGDHAYQLSISSTKSMIGHSLGAAGAIEAIFCVLALRDQVAPPTINLDDPDEGCDLDFVPHESKQREIQFALSNSFGFGGTNGSLLFKKSP